MPTETKYAAAYPGSVPGLLRRQCDKQDLRPNN